MTDEFSTFVISETTVNQINALPNELQLKFYKAVTNYGLNGVEPDLTGMELAVWISMRDLILHTKRKDEKWRQKQQENGKKGGRPKTQNNPDEPNETQNNPDNIWVSPETHNDNVNDKDKDNEFTPTACAVDQKENPEQTKIAPVSRSPPKKKHGIELTEDQKQLFHAAKACFETSEKAKAIMYQDRGSTQMHIENLKLFVVRCHNIAPGITAEFMRNVLEHFKVLVNGRLKNKAEFTPRALITPWVWEMVISTLPENDNELSEGIRESIKGMFK